MSVSFLACSECQLPGFAAFVPSFLFLAVEVQFRCPVAYDGICDLDEQHFSASEQMQRTVAMCACSCGARLTDAGQASCCVQTSSISRVRGGTSRMILLLYLISKKLTFFSQKMVYTKLKTGYYKSRIIAGVLQTYKTFRVSSK